MPKRKSKSPHARSQKVVVLEKTSETTPVPPIEDPKRTKNVIRRVESLGGIWRIVVVPEPETQNEDVVCCQCNKVPKDERLKRCAQCHVTLYCSRECQKQHWVQGGHKVNCNALKMSSKLLIDMTKDESLSEYLFSTLERAGVSWDIRKRHMSTVYNDGNTIASRVNDIQISLHMFGSSTEGAFTSEQIPDYDVVHIFEAVSVVENCTNIIGHADCLHVLTDSKTAPGYVKLQVHRQTPFTIYLFNMFKEGKDGSGRLVLTNEQDSNLLMMLFSNDRFFKRCRKSGPAEQCFHNFVKKGQEPQSLDWVFGFKMCTWPSYAVAWLKRKRNYNWPTPENIAQLRKLQCFCVPVGHAKSKEKHLEWRLSFSSQEQQLMFSLNDVQFKCYVLLKLIKTDVIAPRLQGESLTSYHCKTALFYTIENNSQDIWTPENLLHCALLCLSYLLQCCKTGVFPHYFIPGANLFDGKIEGNQLKQLIVVADGILVDPLKCIQEIKPNNIGKLVYMCNTANLNIADIHEITASSQKALTYRVLDLHYTTVNNIIQLRMVLFEYISGCNTTQDAISRHYHVLKIVCEYCSENDSKGQHRATNIRLILPYVYTSLASHIVVMAMQFRDETIRDWYVCASALYFSKGLNLDLMSSRLKFATLLYIMGHWKSSKLILDDIESRNDIMNDVLTICTCRTLGFYETDDAMSAAFINQSKEKLFRKPTTEFLQTSVCTCVIFLPTEMAITPYALRYEMFRSVSTPPGSRDETSEFWYDWAVVDSKIYIHFLRYLMDIEHPDKHTGNMSICFYDKELSHQETYLNLLGWIAKNTADKNNSDSVTMLALSFNGVLGECRFTPFELVSYAYMQSWEFLQDHFRIILPSGHLHNAVKWHVCVLLYEVWRVKQIKWHVCVHLYEMWRAKQM